MDTRLDLEDIQFDPPITSTVTGVLLPMDRFSRRVVRRGLRATVIDGDGRPLPYRFTRSLSGYLVLTDLPSDVSYSVRLDTRAAGYLIPEDVSLDPSGGNLVTTVLLDPAPGFKFDSGATLIRGIVIDDGEPVDRAAVSVEDSSFRTATDRRGAFALPLHLPAPALGEQPEPTDVVLRFEREGTGGRSMTVTITDGRTHVFSEPIQLGGSNQPPFVDSFG